VSLARTPPRHLACAPPRAPTALVLGCLRATPSLTCAPPRAPPLASSFLVFMGVALSITTFPIMARILVELKLLTMPIRETEGTDGGRVHSSPCGCSSADLGYHLPRASLPVVCAKQEVRGLTLLAMAQSAPILTNSMEHVSTLV
jgi:hypothetical protein